MDGSPELFALVRAMMRADPALRVGAGDVHAHPVVARARAAMERQAAEARAAGRNVLEASPLLGVQDGFLEEILGRPLLADAGGAGGGGEGGAMRDEFAMDLSP